VSKKVPALILPLQSNNSVYSQIDYE